mgnify:CR=1 FL=1
MNNLEKPGNLSSEILEVIDLLIKHCPNVIFGGSIALNAINLIDRPVKDIDLLFEENNSLGYKDDKLNFWQAFTEAVNTQITEGKIESDTVTNTNGEPIQRTGVKIKNINICCFKVKKHELQHSKVKFIGREICIQNVNYVLQAKQSYASKNPKHQEDINNAIKIINDLPF